MATIQSLAARERAAQMTDAGVDHLSRLSVRALQLHATGVSRGGVEKLKAALPMTTIDWHPDRVVALHFLGRGGGVWLEAPHRKWPLVRSPEELPRHDFKVAKIVAAGNPAIGDDDVAQLRNLRGLMEIDLSGTGISDGSIEVPTSFPRLAKIVL